LGSGGPEPLCAFYPVAVRAALESALGSGERSPRRLLEERAFGWLALDDALAVGGRDEIFLNVNTREDLARAEWVLRGERAARGTGEPPG
jgi:molybdopterin-guanine dinucleotide biosynthesis protein A